MSSKGVLNFQAPATQAISVGSELLRFFFFHKVLAKNFEMPITIRRWKTLNFSFWVNLFDSRPFKVIPIPESGNFFLWNPVSGKFLLLEFGIMDFGIRNPANDWNPQSYVWQRIRKPVPGIRIPHPPFKTVLDYLTWDEYRNKVIVNTAPLINQYIFFPVLIASGFTMPSLCQYS